MTSGGLEYRIARWLGFSRSAFTITFDDNYRFQVLYATPLLNRHHYNATYFIVTNRVGKGWAPGWDTLNIMASQGHEIASHSKNHPDFVNLARHPEWADSMRREFRDSRDIINARIPSQRCETFAWPFGSVDTNAIKIGKNYYMACRGTDDHYEGPVPDNFYNIFSRHVYHNTLLDTVNLFIDYVLQQRGWLIERWHGFRVMHDTNGYEPVPLGLFEKHLDYVSQKEDSLWIAPLRSVVKYIRERETSVLALIDSSRDDVLFSLTNPLADTLFHYNFPLSLRIRMYGKMENVHTITQNNNVLPFRISEENGVDYLYVDAVPNDSLIDMHLNSIHHPLSVNSNTVIYPNPFKETASIEFEITEPENASILVYDQIGRLVRDFSRIFPSGKNSIVFSGAGLSPGIYHCIIGTRESRANILMIKTE